MAEFNKMMQEAVEMKKADVAKRQVVFRSRPSFLQHTLYTSDKEETRRYRYRRADVTLSERLARSVAHKEEANALMARGDLPCCGLAYESALGVFCFIHSKNPTWRSKGFEDDDLVVVKDDGGSASGLCELGHPGVSYPNPESVMTAVQSHLIACFNNLANLHTRLGSYGDAVAACDEVLARDVRNVKALYRKAVALTAPASSTTADSVTATECLRRALVLEPGNADVAALASRLSAEAAQSAVTERKYKGFLQRGDGFRIGVDTPAPPAAVVAASPWKLQVSQAEAVIASLRGRAEDAEATALDVQLDAAKANKFFVEWMRPRRFSHVGLLTNCADAPTVATAAALHLDLARPHVLATLQSLIDAHDATALAAMSDSDVLAELMACGMGSADGEGDRRAALVGLRSRRAVPPPPAV